MSIIITEFMDEAAVACLRAHFGGSQVLYEPALVDQPEALSARMPEATALIVRNRTQVRGTLLEQASRLRWLGRLGVGLDNIDVEACTARGIKVVPATGANALAVAEYVIASALMLRRASFGASADVARGDWPRARLSQGRELAGAALGLVGFGGIGRLTGRLAAGLGMRILAYDPVLTAKDPVVAEMGIQILTLDELLSQADVLSLHVPLNESTRGMIDAKRLASMKQGAVLINTARGGLVDEAALAESLRRGHLGGAALDVFAQEPLPADNPFHDCPNLLLTPHIAGVSFESNTRVSNMIAEALIQAYPQGLPA